MKKLSVISPLLLTLTMCLAASLPALASSLENPSDPNKLPLVTEESFLQCKNQFAQLATESGVSSSTIKDALMTATLVSKVIEYDRNQPEFVRTFPTYLTKRVTQWRIDKGRQLLKEHRNLLAKLHQQYGIPPHYLVSFWGLETNFGSYKGKMPIIGSLATLACDQRRSEFFTKELIQALQLIDRESLDTQEMVGSWAGAMGHTQFMPSAYIRYAKDGDGDGKADLWNSIPDALTSAANFLQGLGWTPGFRWGREVQLPHNFDYSLAGRNTRHTLTQWQSFGVTRVDEKALGRGETKGSILVPSGHQGPAFLVYDNFAVIMKWNFSEFYAIAVGYLADRLSGAAPLTSPLPNLPNYSIKQVQELQANLNHLGFDVGTADGILGPATRKGIQGFQVANKMVADGFPSPQVFETVNEILVEKTAR